MEFDGKTIREFTHEKWLAANYTERKALKISKGFLYRFPLSQKSKSGAKVHKRFRKKSSIGRVGHFVCIFCIFGDIAIIKRRKNTKNIGKNSKRIINVNQKSK